MKKTLSTIAFLAFTLSFAHYGRQPYQYQSPQSVDISALGNAATTLQNRYNNNVDEVQSNVNRLSRHINNLDITEDQRERIFTRFKKLLASLQQQSINYSSTSETNSVINWLYDSVNKIIKSETE
mgnify:CR=1 FL=1